MTKKILLCNGAHLGDLILATSILPVLKSTFPSCEIGFLIGSWGLPVLENHLFLNHIHIFDHPRLNRSNAHKSVKQKHADRTWHRAIREIQEKKYEVAIDLYYFYRANCSALISKANISERVGFWGMPGHYHLTQRLFWDHRGLHMVENHKKMLEAWGISENHLANMSPILSYHDDQEFLTHDSLSEHQFILIHVGAGDQRRQWPLNAWQRLVSRLYSLQLPLAFLGKGRKEKVLIEELMRCAPDAVNLCDLLEWRQVYSLVKQARLVIGLESMCGHLAAVANTPGIFLYGQQSNIPCWRPYNACCHVLAPSFEEEMEAYYMKKSRYSSLQCIQPEAVYEKTIELLT